MKTQFSESQFERAYPTGMGAHWWFIARNKIILRMLKKYRLDESNILEIGCGKGIVVDYLRSENIQCKGVELAPISPIDSVRAYISTGTDAVDLPANERNKVDTILLLDVIEHIQEPETFLRQLEEAFPNANWLVVTVPARQEIWSNYDEYYGHHRRYAIPMLKELISSLSWRLGTAHYFFHGIYLPARLMSLLRIRRATKLTAPSAGTKIIHRLIARLMILEYCCLPRTVLGTSIISLIEIRRHN